MLPADPNLKVSLPPPPARLAMAVKLMLLPRVPLPAPVMIQVVALAPFGPVSVFVPLPALSVTGVTVGAAATTNWLPPLPPITVTLLTLAQEALKLRLRV